MPTAIAMPRLGMTMREGTVVAWRIAPGQSVARGDPLLVIESEKAEVDVEAPASGVLRHVYVEPGNTVACGTLLAALTESAEEPFDPEAFRSESGGAPSAAPTPEPAAPSGQAPKAAGARGAAPITPAARRRARELGLDPSEVPGSGPGGRVLREDVEALAQRLEARLRTCAGVAFEAIRSGAGSRVVLVPGFGTDWSAFARQLPVLAESHEVVALNPRGVGVSDPPGSDYGIGQAADELAELDDAPAHWIGASLGASVVLELAWRHPERVRSLTLITPFLEVPPRLRAVLDAWVGLVEHAPPTVVAASLAPWLFSPAALADSARSRRIVQGLAEIVPRIPPATLARAFEALLLWSGTRGPGDLTQIAAPVLVIAADEDLLTPGAEALAREIPAAKLERIAGAGHAVALEAPEAVNGSILHHLARADERA